MEYSEKPGFRWSQPSCWLQLFIVLGKKNLFASLLSVYPHAIVRHYARRLFVTFIYSRILGTPQRRRAILETRYTRYTERMVEESTELIGYTIMAFGICRYELSLSKVPRVSRFKPCRTEERETGSENG